MYFEKKLLFAQRNLKARSDFLSLAPEFVIGQIRTTDYSDIEYKIYCILSSTFDIVRCEFGIFDITTDLR